MGILKAGVATTLVAGIGLGLTVGWGLNEIARGSLRGAAGPRPREEEEAGEPGPCQTAPAVPPATPTQPPVGTLDQVQGRPSTG